jgi:hypothetical protein
MSWRTICLALAAVCIAQLWRDCTRAMVEPRPVAECAPPRAMQGAVPSAASGAAGRAGDRAASAGDAEPSAAAAADGEPGGDGASLYGVQVPGWVAWMAPHPGEDLRAYRDRMLPLAVAAIAPQRARIARSRDSFAALAGLDAGQRAELDAAAQDAAAALQDRVMSAVLGGELAPAVFKPMAGVALARDLLDIVSRGNRRFLEALRGDQRAQLAQHPFDFADYLVFSTRWEDALGLL